MNEVDKLFEGLPDDQPKKEGEDIFGDTEVKPAPEEGNNKDKTEDDEPRKNRRHRRLEAQLQQEREARIAAEARADAVSESQRFSSDEGEVDERFLRIYGDTPETRQAWKLQQDILNDYKQEAKQEAIREIEERDENVKRQTREYESFIDDELEGIEDEFDVDVTSDAPAARKARREFLEMVQQASPKDEDGTITGYADFSAVWEFYQTKKSTEKQNSNRNKDISSRSMEKSSGAPKPGQNKITPGFDGWRKDYGV